MRGPDLDAKGRLQRAVEKWTTSGWAVVRHQEKRPPGSRSAVLRRGSPSARMPDPSAELQRTATKRLGEEEELGEIGLEVPILPLGSEKPANEKKYGVGFQM